MIEPTADLVRKLFTYRGGDMYWNISPNNRIQIGDRAGTLQKTGYRTIGIDGKIYLAHRIIFLYHNGYVPEYLDHIDGNKINNDINNLRATTKSQNAMNKDGCKSTSSIYKGVSWNIPTKKWMAQITIDYKAKNIGRFNTETEAARAYNKAAIGTFGEFARLNDIGDI